MFNTVETITPDMALSYLSCNQGNRPVRVNQVKSLADAIKRGEWRLTHQGIAFSSNGRLLDGQHRLSAIVEAGVPVRSLVSRGLDDETFMSIDIGNRRSHADVLRTDQKLVEVANLCNYILTNSPRSTPDQVARFLPIVEEPHTFLIDGNKSTTRIISSAGFRLAAVLSMEDGSPREYVRGMYHSLLTMDIESLPPVGRSLVAQIARESFGGRGSGRATSLAALSRGMVVFDRSKRDLSRVMVKDSATAMAWARELLAEMLAKAGAA